VIKPLSIDGYLQIGVDTEYDILVINAKDEGVISTISLPMDAVKNAGSLNAMKMIMALLECTIKGLEDKSC
jgi:hypothetical protein